jgi:hypothetical protein
MDTLTRRKRLRDLYVKLRADRHGDIIYSCFMHFYDAWKESGHTETDLAMDLHFRALEAAGKWTQPSSWAFTLTRLSFFYNVTPYGVAGPNNKAALCCAHRALEIYTRAETPCAWTTALSCLSRAYLMRSDGTWLENTQAAIAAAGKALSVLTVGFDDYHWHDVYRDLGLAS